MEQYDARTAKLARELKRVVGQGLAPKKLLGHDELRSLPRVRALGDAATPEDVAEEIEKLLRAAVSRISGSKTLRLSHRRELTISEFDTQKAIALVLGLRNDSRYLSADDRRTKAKASLGLHDMSDTDWRRPAEEYPEMQLMNIMAQSLLGDCPALRIDLLAADCQVGWERHTEIVWNMTALRPGQSRVSMTRDRGESLAGLAREPVLLRPPYPPDASGIMESVDHDTGIRILEIELADTRAHGPKRSLRVELDQARIKPFERNYVRFLALDLRPLEATVRLRFVDGYPEGLVWAFEGLLSDAQIRFTEPWDDAGYVQSNHGVFEKTFIRPLGRYGLAWRADALVDLRQFCDAVIYNGTSEQKKAMERTPWPDLLWAATPAEEPYEDEPIDEVDDSS